MNKRAVIIIVADTIEGNILMEAGQLLGFETSYSDDFDSLQRRVRWIDRRGDLDHFAMYEVPEGSPIPKFWTRRYRDAIQGGGEQGDALQERSVVSEAGVQQPRESGQGGRSPSHEGLRVEGEIAQNPKIEVQVDLAETDTYNLLSKKREREFLNSIQQELNKEK